MEHFNTYEDRRRAAAFDQLGLGGTYHLAFRDLPRLLADHVTGTDAVDFGCGAGRSTRFLTSLGFRTVGLDISKEMVDIARSRDPGGAYRVIADGDLSSVTDRSVDLVLSAFTFDNIPGLDHRTHLLRSIRKLLSPKGRFVNIVSTPEIYIHEWVTFSTRDYPENKDARPGDIVRIVTTEYDDSRPVEDILWPHQQYLEVYAAAGLTVERTERPLARDTEGVSWVSETSVAPWAIYVLRSATEPTPTAQP